jgi:hypothetical protein
MTNRRRSPQERRAYEISANLRAPAASSAVEIYSPD